MENNMTTYTSMYDSNGMAHIWYVADLERGEGCSFSTLEREGPLYEFLRDIQLAFRGCVVKCSDVEATAGVWHVYMPDDVYTMGWVDINPRDNVLYTYSVYSRLITNNKYGQGTRDFRTVTTTIPKKALKNAKEYLRRLTHADLVRCSIEKATSKIHDACEKSSSVFKAAFCTAAGVRHVSNHEERMMKPMLDEMLVLLDTEHSFIDPSMSDNLAQLRDTRKARDLDILNSKADVYAIRVYEKLGRQVFESIRLDGGLDNHSNRYARVSHQASEVFYEDTLPEGVLGKLSALAICDKDEYIPQVGYRYDESVFYVTC
tara:strand:- start:406 stop:1356 length:951 start_codon:yes stop_codon:yes gene_type:complete